MSARMKSRLERLESARGARASLPTLHLATYGRDDGEVVGVESPGHGVAVERLPGESIAYLKARASAEHPHVRVWMATYTGDRHEHA